MMPIYAKLKNGLIYELLEESESFPEELNFINHKLRHEYACRPKNNIPDFIKNHHHFLEKS